MHGKAFQEGKESKKAIHTEGLIKKYLMKFLLCLHLLPPGTRGSELSNPGYVNISGDAAPNVYILLLFQIY